MVKRVHLLQVSPACNLSPCGASISNGRRTAALLHRTQVLTSSGLPASQVKHLAGGVYAYAGSGMPMVSKCRGLACRPCASRCCCVALSRAALANSGLPMVTGRFLLTRAMRVCATHCSTHPTAQEEPCTPTYAQMPEKQEQKQLTPVCHVTRALPANLPAERRVRRLWRWPHASSRGKALRRIHRQVNGVLIRNSPAVRATQSAPSAQSATCGSRAHAGPHPACCAL